MLIYTPKEVPAPKSRPNMNVAFIMMQIYHIFELA